MGGQQSIFLIYTSEDEKAAFMLVHHLEHLKTTHNVLIWKDDPIFLGRYWQPMFDWRMEADVFLFLLSDAFMHSEFIHQLEFKSIIDKFKEGKTQVIPIILENCPWDIDFKADDYNFNFNELHVLPKGGKPIAEFRSPGPIYEEIALFVGKSLTAFPTVGVLPDIVAALPQQGEGSNKLHNVPPILDVLTHKDNANDIVGTDAEIVVSAGSSAQPTKDPSPNQRVFKTSAILKKNVIIIGVLVVLACVVYTIFPVVIQEKQNGLQVQPNANSHIETKVVEPIVPDPRNVPMVLEKEQNITQQMNIGDLFEGGMIFMVNQETATGKIAFLQDSGPMPWKNAMDIHLTLGDGWRLPTLPELQAMHKTIGPGADNKGNFEDGLYWSATDYDDFQARLLKFSNGNSSYHYGKGNENRKFWVRAVRDIGE